MTQLAKPTGPVEVKDVLVRLRMGKKVQSHAGSDPSELAARVATEGTWVNSGNAVEFADAIEGPPGPPIIHVGPTPPTNINLLWIDTS